MGRGFRVRSGKFLRKCLNHALGVGVDFPVGTVIWSVWWAVERSYLAVAWQPNWWCVPLVFVLLSKILLLFNYFLSLACSSFIYLFSYILYFTLYLCYLLIAVCFFFLVCVCVRKSVVCIFYFFLVFLLPLFISQNSITIFLCFLHF